MAVHAMTTLESKIANRLQPLMARASTAKQWAEIDRLEAEMLADELMKMEHNQWTQHS